MTDVVYYLFNSLRISSQPSRLMLLKWVKVTEEIFNEILSTVTEDKNKGFKARQWTNRQSGVFKKKHNNIVDDVRSILNTPRLTRSQNKMV